MHEQHCYYRTGPLIQQLHVQVVHAMDKLGRPADKMRIKKVLEEFYRSVGLQLGYSPGLCMLHCSAS